MARLYAAIVYKEKERRERIYRTRDDAFSLDDDSFVNLFRVSKRIALNLCEQLRPELQPMSTVPTTINVETQVLCCLRFFATGSYQRAIGQDLLLTISQTSVSRSIRKVSSALNSRLLHETISFPHVPDYASIKRAFMEASGFPGVIGAIDCTHVAIVAPPEPLEDAYVNRKGFHSINVQLVCDTNLKILNVNAKHAGKTHDSFIWRHSALRDILEEENRENNERKSWLLGDSGYPLEPWLMTPILYPATDAERRYNLAHAKARNAVERCNGVLKSRFCCLSRHRALIYDPTTASRIINSCAILHNLCLKYNIEIEDENANEDDDDDDDDNNNSNNSNNDATCIRNHIIRNHFYE